ncbi:alpha/beta hydrolase family protein [Actinoplanes couchii]|uniref:Esterase n=1 Tax=Actinoplanes couchii TaxID=403638 RepID=A0ABQ3X898_9ACTN|nr:alpha/beta hydrolase [Actinoplanes couchii]MDR6320253.1 putative dienelactone hydrolase [Actinoplanes couchii]GID54733.1 esterase [Actinoplanes couchii]
MKRLIALTALVLGGVAVPGGAAASSSPVLPAPTGPYPVGVATLHLTDVGRADPWVPASGDRELMVSVWYPAASAVGETARYLSAVESEAILRGAGIADVPGDSLSGTRTHEYPDAVPAGRARSLPTVVLSPGFTWPRSSLTALAEDLSSHGYAVIGIDHTYETFATTFPDGRVATCAACMLEEVDDFGAQAVQNRAVDVSFVLDRFFGERTPWPGAGLLDPERIAMVGSSLGGASSAETMLHDRRVDVGANLDGTMFEPVPAAGLDRPFLFLGEPAHRPGGADPTWDRDWERLLGWKRWLTVTGAVHASFTDYDLLAEEIGVDLGSELSGVRTVEITRRYVRAFLDRHLRGRSQPLLDRPSVRYPEVVVH